MAGQLGGSTLLDVKCAATIRIAECIQRDVSAIDTRAFKAEFAVPERRSQGNHNQFITRTNGLHCDIVDVQTVATAGPIFVTGAIRMFI